MTIYPAKETFCIKSCHAPKAFGSHKVLSGWGKVLLALILIWFSEADLSARELLVQHDLQIRLFPASHRLSGVDTITFSEEKIDAIDIRLSGKASIGSVRVNGKPAGFSFRGGRLRVRPMSKGRSEIRRVTVEYQALFDGPIPEHPANTDNPGYGVTGTVSETGTFLLSGAGWYPEVVNARPAYTLRVTAPAGILAVTAGKSIGHVTENSTTVSTWQITRPVEGLSLSAARYVVDEKQVSSVRALTYFSEGNHHLAGDYLDATAAYITMYEKMFGPYPFDKFAVVENFFPTGFGFPSYTLLGSRVLRLPFIIRTSLGHEIAHCWWGNGVLLAGTGGNWSEGLTAYVADYLYREKASDRAARDYRRQLLRNYADLVDPRDDFSLDRFRGRYDRITKTVGYDKSAMVFHMLRRRLGEEAFWGALRDLFKKRLFQPTSWNDFRLVFERRGRVSLKDFFREWVSRPGAVRLALGTVSAEPEGPGWTVSGHLLQKAPFYDVAADLTVETDSGPVTHTLSLVGAKTPFKMAANGVPRRLVVDPEYDIFRRLYPSEIPPSVNTLKGSASILLVVPETLDAGIRDAAQLLVRALGLDSVEEVTEDRLTAYDLTVHDLLFVGIPENRDLLPEVSERVVMGKRSFNLNAVRYDDPGDAFFGVFARPAAGNRVVAVFLPLSPLHAETAARKITHYGKYSYLSFSRGQNRDKGTWPVSESPLIHQFSFSK